MNILVEENDVRGCLEVRQTISVPMSIDRRKKRALKMHFPHDDSTKDENIFRLEFLNN